MHALSTTYAKTIIRTQFLRFFVLYNALLAWQTSHSMEQYKLNQNLLNAAMHGNTDRVTKLLRQGANIHARDTNRQTSLHKAVGLNHLKVATLLLDRGADVNAIDCHKLTPLHQTAGWDNAKIAALLLDKDANIHARDEYGHSPLHKAACLNGIKVATLLLNRGADINAIDHLRLTPLHQTAVWDNAKIAAFLLDRGANLHAIDHIGQTPLHKAVEHGNETCVTVLLKRGANPYLLDKKGNATGDIIPPWLSPFNHAQTMLRYEKQLHRRAIHTARQCLSAAMETEQTRRDGILQLPPYPMEIIARFLVGSSHAPQILLKPGDSGIEELSTPAYAAKHALCLKEGILRHALELMSEQDNQKIAYARWAYRYPQLHLLTSEQMCKRHAIEQEAVREHRRLMSGFTQTSSTHSQHAPARNTRKSTGKNCLCAIM